MSAIVKTYVTLIREGRRTLESVPELIRAKVQAIFDADAGSAE